MKGLLPGLVALCVLAGVVAWLLQPDVGPAGQDFLMRTFGESSLATLEQRLQESYLENEKILSTALAPYERSREAP